MPTLVETTPFILGPCLGKMTKYTPCLQGGKGGGVTITNHKPIFVQITSLRKQPTSREVATCALAKRLLNNERRNSILMTRHYPDLGSASDWLKRTGTSFQPIRSTT